MSKGQTAANPLPKPLSPRRRPAQDRARRSVSALLSSAARIVAEEGLERVTVARIADAAGLSVGAAYEYFPNKEAILVAVGRAWLDRVREGLDALHPTRSGIADYRSYRRQALAFTEACYRDQPGLGVLLNCLSAIPTLREIEKKHDEHVVESFTSTLLHFFPGSDPDDAAAIARTCIVMTHAVFSECIVRGGGDAQRMIQKLWIAQSVLLLPLEATQSENSHVLP